jgi:hypothetical protein
MSDNQQSFKLYDPDGMLIAHGATASKAMAPLPGSVARQEELQQMYSAVAEAVEAKEREQEAEQRAEQALATSAQILSDGISRLATRLDAEEDRRALAAKEAEEEQQRKGEEEVRAYLAALPDPEQPEPMGTSDDDPLTAHPPVDHERNNPEHEPLETDAAATQDPNQMGEVYDPQPRPDPGSRLYPPHPGIAQPVSISLNSEREEE